MLIGFRGTGKRREAKDRAVLLIKKATLFAFISYPIVGVAGCFVRELNEIQAGNIHNFKWMGLASYSNEAVIAPFVVLAVGILMAVLIMAIRTNK